MNRFPLSLHLEMQKLVNQTYQLAENAVESFRKQLILDEKREATIQKYTHDVRRFLSYHGKQTVCKEDVIQYKAWLAERYAVRSTNSMLIALNQFLRFQGAGDCCVKPLKVQRQTFCDKKKELSQAEYFRLLEAARRNGDMRLHLAIQTICATGIRVSELAYITVEAARLGRAIASNKGKSRIILIPKELCRNLLDYARERGIQDGPIFVTRGGADTEPQQHLECHETAVQICTGWAGKSISAQPKTPVCPYFL